MEMKYILKVKASNLILNCHGLGKGLTERKSQPLKISSIKINLSK